MGEVSDWKLKLRYGRVTTPFTHYTLLADGRLLAANEKLGGEPGPAFFGLKIWAVDDDEAFIIYRDIASREGFEIGDKIDLWTTDPERPPKDRPYAYGPKLTAYSED